MLHQRAGAEDRRAFLVAGDDQADRSRLDRRCGRRGDEGGDRALHVDRAAPVEQIAADFGDERVARSEEHTSELQSLMRTSYAGFRSKKKKNTHIYTNHI